MNTSKHHLITLLLLFVLSASCAPLADTQTMSTAPVRPTFKEYSSSIGCRQCHERAYDEHKDSFHAKSFTDPVFQAQYLKELIPLTKNNPDLEQEARECLSCHNPITYVVLNRTIKTEAEMKKYPYNVTCDFCHTIKHFKGKTPGNGNYIPDPGQNKYGPHKTESNWHHIYNPLQRKSEFCAICHNDHNHKGLEIKSTYTEWKESPYAKKGIDCQDCHMNAIGFLAMGRAIYKKGQAASMRIAKPPHRKNLHTHRFPGSHSAKQVTGALKVKIKPSVKSAKTSDIVQINVFVDNSRSGHKMPSGSTDLRVIWLELTATLSNGNTILIKATPENNGNAPYSTSGYNNNDLDTFGKTISAGNRIYRQIFVDADGKQTITSYLAVKSIFDNRLKAAEIRKDSYTFTVPPSSGSILLTAKLKYLRYPQSFAKKLGIPEAETITIASATNTLLIK